LLKLSGVLAVAVFLAVFSAPTVYNAFTIGVGGGSATAPKIVHKEGKCVRDADWMRHNHMQFLMSERDEVVREGVREKDHGIKGCRSCHPNRGEFCDRCHGYVGIQPECWNCHYYPVTASVK
jgi:hypothetical protein